MQKRKKIPSLEEALASQSVKKPRPEDQSFLTFVDQLVSLEEEYEREKRERELREADAMRELEKLAAQFQADQERELARRAECRRLRLEREAAEAAEKAAKGSKSGSEVGSGSGKASRNASRRSLGEPGAI